MGLLLYKPGYGLRFLCPTMEEIKSEDGEKIIEVAADKGFEKAEASGKIQKFTKMCLRRWK